MGHITKTASLEGLLRGVTTSLNYKALRMDFFFELIEFFFINGIFQHFSALIEFFCIHRGINGIFLH
jgi:hypothetical protein